MECLHKNIRGVSRQFIISYFQIQKQILPFLFFYSPLLILKTNKSILEHFVFTTPNVYVPLLNNKQFFYTLFVTAQLILNYYVIFFNLHIIHQ